MKAHQAYIFLRDNAESKIIRLEKEIHQAHLKEMALKRIYNDEITKIFLNKPEDMSESAFEKIVRRKTYRQKKEWELALSEKLHLKHQYDALIDLINLYKFIVNLEGQVLSVQQ